MCHLYNSKCAKMCINFAKCAKIKKEVAKLLIM